MRPVQVFLSYRRDDSAGYARAIYDALAAQFGDDRVFIDVDDIGAGQAFDEVIAQAVGQSEVLLVLIGKRWLGHADASHPADGAGGAPSRLHQPNDFVRREVESAFAKGMRVVPLLLDGATMPSAAQLPASLQLLATRNALAIDNNRFASDLQRLVVQLRGWLGEPVTPGAHACATTTATATATTPPGRAHAPGPARWWRVGAAALVLLAAVALGLQQAGLAPFSTRTSGAAAEATPSTGQTRAPAQRPAVNGRWSAELNYDWPGAHFTERFTFSGEGADLQGSASFLRVPRGILNGMVAGATLRFDTQSSELLGEQTRTLTHHYRVELVGNELRGTLQTEGGSSAPVPVAFTARREPGP
jgi:hypothetical protein